MNRRRVMAVLGSAGLVSLSGCSAVSELFGDDEDNERDQSNTPTQQNNSSQSGTNDQQTETPSDRSERSEIHDTYREGVTQVNDGIRSREAAVGAFNNDQFNRAAREANGGVQSFDRARSTFRNARDMALEISNQRAVEICETAMEHATVLRTSMETLERAAELAQDGQAEQASERIDRVRELELEAERLNPPDSGVMFSVLGLD